MSRFGLLLALLVGCGPIHAPPTKHFVFVVKNLSTGNATINVRWAIGGVYVGTTSRLIPPWQDGVFVLGEAGPDLVEIDSTAVKTAFGPADWNGHFIFGFVYPYGNTWSEQ